MTLPLWPLTQAPLLELVVPGTPATQGSMTLWRAPDGSERVKYPTSTVGHRNLVIGTLVDYWQGAPPITGPVAVTLVFQFPYLAKHFNAAKVRKLRLDAPTWKDTAPDLDKLVRLVFDALTIAGVWVDDKQGCDLRTQKCYGYSGLTAISLYHRKDDADG